jgi:hypothetical protein
MRDKSMEELKVELEKIQQKITSLENSNKNKGFVLTKILSAKPFIADLCFEPEAK